MKKSELKALLKVITEEVAAIKETKGLSGFKETKDSTEHTEKIASSKDLTGKTEPKNKAEGKKLPKVPTPKQPKVGLKEDIVSMIREAIEECGIEEMARTAGAVAPEFRKEIEPGKWVIMGHPNQTKYPDGTPTTAPKGPYVKKGRNTDLGRPTKTPDSKISAGMGDSIEIARTEEAVEDFIKYNPNASEQEVTDAISDQNTDETPLSLDPDVIKTAIGKAKRAKAPTLSDDEEEELAAEKAAEEEKRMQANIEKDLQRARQIKKPVTPRKQAVRDKFAAYIRNLKK